MTARCWTTRKRDATNAESVSDAFAAGLAPGAVEVRERRRLVDEHAAGQVDRQRDAGILRHVDRLVDDLLPPRVHATA